MVWPQHPDADPPHTGRFWCRGCGQSGDAIAYVMQHEGVDFKEACQRLSNGSVPTSAAPPKALGRSRQRRSNAKPGEQGAKPNNEYAEWRRKAIRIAGECEANLWGAGDGEYFDAADARVYLASRGLSEDTLRDWSIGFSPGVEINGPWVPRGIVLPWWVKGQLELIKVRQPPTTLPGQSPPDPKYKRVKGKGGDLLIFGARPKTSNRPIVIMVAGEFDSMLLQQEIGDRAQVVTLGSESEKLKPNQMAFLLRPGLRVFAVYDTDAAGQAGAARLRLISARVRRITVPDGTDITDRWQRGGDLRSWVAAAQVESVTL